jgi:hypothetical protein
MALALMGGFLMYGALIEFFYVRRLESLSLEGLGLGAAAVILAWRRWWRRPEGDPRREDAT